MKLFTYVSLVSLLLMVATAGVLAQEMTKEEWQKQITELTSKRNDMNSKLSGLKSEVENLKSQDAAKAAALKQCQDELLAMAGGTPEQIAAYEKGLKKIDTRLATFQNYRSRICGIGARNLKRYRSGAEPIRDHPTNLRSLNSLVSMRLPFDNL